MRLPTAVPTAQGSTGIDEKTTQTSPRRQSIRIRRGHEWSGGAGADPSTDGHNITPRALGARASRAGSAQSRGYGTGTGRLRPDGTCSRSVRTCDSLSSGEKRQSGSRANSTNSAGKRSGRWPPCRMQGANYDLSKGWLLCGSCSACPRPLYPTAAMENPRSQEATARGSSSGSARSLAPRAGRPRQPAQGQTDPPYR